VLIVGEFYFIGFGVGEQLLKLLKRLAGNEDALLAADAFERLVWFFNEGEAMAVGGNHGEGLRFDDEQRAVECIAGLFVGYGEDRARDESLESNERNAGGGDGRKLRDLGIVGACHANDFGIGAAAADLTQWLSSSLMEMSPSGAV